MINAIADVSTAGTCGFMRNQQINCDDCDLDSEDSRELKTHNGNMHDIRIQNETVKEPRILSVLCASRRLIRQKNG